MIYCAGAAVGALTVGGSTATDPSGAAASAQGVSHTAANTDIVHHRITGSACPRVLEERATVSLVPTGRRGPGAGLRRAAPRGHFGFTDGAFQREAAASDARVQFGALALALERRDAFIAHLAERTAEDVLALQRRRALARKAPQQRADLFDRQFICRSMRMNESRRMSAWSKRRCPPALRKDMKGPRASWKRIADT